MEMEGRKCGLSPPQDLSSAILLSADDDDERALKPAGIIF
jgi:hypothetical protein